MTQEAAAKKDIQRLQRAIIDGLEDVKAQDIQVFNTEHLSPLFERVIVASGTSNRQTKALAASVRDAVREAGYPKPRTEGEENGEWIIVDCGAAVAHVMQPAIRQYYHLEEIWGEKPVRLKFGAPMPATAQREAESVAPAKTLRKSSAAKSAHKAADAANKAPAKRASKTPSRTSAGKATAKAPGSAAKTARTGKPPVKVVANVGAKSAARRTASKSAAGKTGSGKSAPSRSAPAKKAPARKG